jgi:uncharacterized protein YbbC (DUF1343 family)
MSVLLGSDILFDRQTLRGRTVGLVCNPASVDAQWRHLVQRAEAAGVRVGAMFGPQHGFRSDVQDNMIETPHADDARRRVPVYSLYSDTREPTAAMLAGLDALIVELQDVGTRIYTYVYTMANCLKAARRHGLPVFVCDRPNPIGGLAVEGDVLDERFTSFVGQYPIPMRHGMTIGELALMFNREFGIGCELEVLKMDGWRRSMSYDETGQPWVLPSPNIPTVDTAVVYPGCVMLEGTNISEGRGTTRPFEIIGAAYIESHELIGELMKENPPGVVFRPLQFQPTFHKFAGELCGGIQIHVIDRNAFKPVITGAAIISAGIASGELRKQLDPKLVTLALFATFNFLFVLCNSRLCGTRDWDP